MEQGGRRESGQVKMPFNLGVRGVSTEDAGLNAVMEMMPGFRELRFNVTYVFAGAPRDILADLIYRAGCLPGTTAQA